MPCSASSSTASCRDGSTPSSRSGRWSSTALGSFALGLLTGLGVGGDGLLLAGVAALGSFTTFSTWMLETERLAEDGEYGLGVANIVGSVALGLAAAGLGWAIGASL